MSEKVCTLVFLRRENEILLAMKKRGFGSNLYNGIGGKIEPGESVEEALIRETQEEIGVTPRSFTKVAEHDFYSETPEPWNMFVHTYICHDWEGEPTESDEMAPEWFDIENIPYDKMWDDDRYWLPQVLGGVVMRSRFDFDENDKVSAQKIVIVDSLH